MMDVNSGYIGHSMSRRAAEAYEDGEMPKSKWTKKAMVAAIQSYCDEFDMSFDPDVLKGMRKDEVFERFSTNRRGTTPPSSSMRRISTSSMKMQFASRFDR